MSFFSAPAGSNAPEPRATKRKLFHVSRACNSCRRRKAKCSGDVPSCESCLISHEDCSYSGEHDGRKPASKQYLKALQERVKALEALLDGEAISHVGIETVEDITAGGGARVGIGKARKAGGTDGEALPEDLERLKLDDETGEFRQYGPTSAFSLLSTSPLHAAASPASLSSTSYSFLEGRDAALLPSTSTTSCDFFGAAGVDGNRSHVDVDVEWCKNLPSFPGFDEALHTDLLALFFGYFCSWCRWTNEDLFRRDMSLCLSPPTALNPTLPIRTSYYSTLLHNALLSLAVSYSDDPRLTESDAGLKFAARAKEAIEDEAERPMLSTVQGLMLLGSYHSGNARHGLGWVYAGMGLRMSTTLGLGIDCSAWVRRGLVTEAVKNERDQTAYLCYVQDKLWSLYVGRAATLTTSTFETPLPSVNPALDAASWPPVAVSARQDDSGFQGDFDFEFGGADTIAAVPSWASTTFLWTCKLAKLAERVMEALYGLKPQIYSSRVQNLVSQLHLELEKWHSELPNQLHIASHSKGSLPSHILMLHFMFWFLLILLYRPFYSRQRTRPNAAFNELAAVKHCDKAASKIVLLLELYRQSPGLRYAPISLIQITFTAGTIHLLTAVNSDSRRAPKRNAIALEAAQTCVISLEVIGKSWKGATQSAAILSRLIVEWCPSPTKTEPLEVEAVAQHALDPQSDLAVQLLALGWTPPTQNPVDPLVSTSQSFAPTISNLYSPHLHALPRPSYPFPLPPVPLTFAQPFFADLQPDFEQQPFSDESMLALFQGTTWVGTGLPVTPGWGGGPAGEEIDAQWLHGLERGL